MRIINEACDRLDILEVTNRIALLADLWEWNELRECFCDQVEVDYTSEFGGQPQRLSAQ
ncbi:nuclear transport factor 2 family protein [Phormidium tenue FACHB-886]|nr:nuclear transport factor 2 family protein [Phormidium tenue FACHB-886]